MSHRSDTLTGTHNITSEVSPLAVRDPNVIKQHTANGVISAVSAGPSAGDLTEERATLESVLHSEAAGLPHLPGPRQHSAGGASRRDTQDAISLSHLRARLLVGVPIV